MAEGVTSRRRDGSRSIDGFGHDGERGRGRRLGGNGGVHNPFRLPDARARLGPWPYEPDVTQLVLLDHHMCPSPTVIRGWVEHALAERSDLRAVRTGAMFPAAAAAFAAAGFRTIDTLALLEAPLGGTGGRPGRAGHSVTTRRLRAHHLPEVAGLDRRAFGDPWGNDVRSLEHIVGATPRHRARVVTTSGSTGRKRVSGFAMTGLAGAVGYLQRLAVDPSARRAGIARCLVDDSLAWMQRRGATTAMVNTGVDNAAALRLYEAAGFTSRSETLKILELSADDLALFASPSQPRSPSDLPDPT